MIYGTPEGDLKALDDATGKELWSFSTGSGIARAIEDETVVAAITGGAKGGILLSLIEWSGRAEMTIEWHHVRTLEEARLSAGKVRALRLALGELRFNHTRPSAAHHSGVRTFSGLRSFTLKAPAGG